MDCLTVFVDEFLIFFSAFPVVLLVLGPERSSFSTDPQSALKSECHSKTAVWLKEGSPKASQSIFVADLPSFKQNLIRHVARFCHPLQTKQEVEKALM
jgi:hypothetical protein